jgi:hypothetical protein
LAVAVLAAVPASAQVFPDAPPTSRPAAGHYSPRLLALGEPRFADTALYNLFDQGGSPMGLLETRKERLGLALGYLGTRRATPGDSLTIDHSDLVIPNVGFFQPGVFGASLYFLREAEAYRRLGGDSVENSASLFGLDLAAGPSSGLFRIGFSAHARIGGIEYPGQEKRILVSVPSVRFDMGSRLHPAVEVGVFAGAGGRFDSLQSPTGGLERVASFTLPRYGLLVDVGGAEDAEDLPVMGNVVLERGTDRIFGEYRPVGDSGHLYPTVLTDYWTLQTQWMYSAQVEDFRLQPALRFARRSEKAQGYAGLKGNQDPFKKGARIDSLQLTRGITAFGLGGQVGFREMAALLLEWETSGHSYKSDSTREERYSRFSVGLEHHVHRLPIEFPEAVSLTLRAGWTWRQDARTLPGYRGFHFDPFLPSSSPGARPDRFGPAPDAPAAYSAYSFGASLGLLEDRLGVDVFLGLPEQPEQAGIGSREASGTEFGVAAAYRVF